MVRFGSSQHHRSFNRRTAYSLLELLLALGLSVIIFAAIAAAIRIHLVSIATQQAKIEQRQVARNLLTVIGNDLRSAVIYRSANYSGLENIRETEQKRIQQQMGLVPAPTPAAGGATVETTQEVIQEDEVSYRPVLKGGRRSVLFDISRLPRLDQYLSASKGRASTQTTADIKSVSYFCSELPLGGSGGASLEPRAAQPGGLYRRELNRAAAAFAGDTGLQNEPDEFCQLLAPEISAIEFRYFDGDEWQTTWNFTEKKELPTAIEIRLALDPRRTSFGRSEGSDGSQILKFRNVVHLPLAKPTEPDES